MPETTVLCGGVAAPRRTGKQLRLSTIGSDANVLLSSEAIGRRMLASLPNVLADLLDVAAYVYCADQHVSRGGATARALGSDWRRNFRFIIPVREPDRWTAPDVREGLEQTLAFLSDETFRFDFVASREPAKVNEYFDFGTVVGYVNLFSGGLDSLTGAVERLDKDNSQLILVSHQSSTKIASRQSELAEELGRRYSDRVVHIPVRVTMRGIEAIERTQRTRSFLFTALAAAVAELGSPSRIGLCENGIVSINLPIASQVVGAAATRTTHPRFVRHMSDFLSALLGRPMEIDNPFLWKTKTEVAELLRRSGHADLARRTVSCSRVYWMTRLHTHCGRCSQCLDRRFGALAAELGEDDPPEMYEVDLLTGGREDAMDLTMAESFVRHALELRDLTDRTFMGRFAGEVARVVTCMPDTPADRAAKTMLDLHHRHAGSVGKVLEDGFRQHARALADQTLPSTCILRMVAGPNGIAPVRALPAPVEPDRPDTRDFGVSSQIRLAVDEQRCRVLVAGVRPIEGPTAVALVRTLTEISEADRAEKRAPEHYRFTRAAKLADAMDLSEPSLRRCIRRVRERLAESFEHEAGLSISANALVENAPWKGYRLNPAVLILTAEEIGE